jgi:hypothetical protein
MHKLVINSNRCSPHCDSRIYLYLNEFDNYEIPEVMCMVCGEIYTENCINKIGSKIKIIQIQNNLFNFIKELI